MMGPEPTLTGSEGQENGEETGIGAGGQDGEDGWPCYTPRTGAL